MRAFFADAIGWLLGVAAAHQYVTLYLVITIEEAGLPLPAPGDLVIAFYGFRARDDPIEIVRVILVCAAASTTGTLIPYAIARRWGMAVARRLVGWMHARPATLDAWTGRIKRNGFRAVVIGRLVPGMRVAISLVAGTADVPVAEFAAGVFVAATIYWTAWVLLGALIGPAIEELVAPTYLGYIVVALPVLFVGYLVLRALLARRHQR